MASSQVEIASNSPFGYVLKDRNRHDHRYRTMESNAFQKNFKDLVQTHLNSCISGHSRNSGSSFIDYTDLWVHNPQNVNNENDFHSQNSGDTGMSRHSDSNGNSHCNIEYTDLWVHHPQRNGNENHPKKTKAGEKWDKARDMVFESSAGRLSSSEKVRNQDSASSGPVSTSQRVKSPDIPSSGPVSTSQKGRIQDGAYSGPVSISQRGTSKEGAASSGAVSTSNRERNRDSSSSGPVSTSQRGRTWEVVSSRLFSFSQRRKSQEGMPSGHDFRSQRENSPAQSESSVEMASLPGVSSLLQKWRGFEAESKSLSAINSPLCTSRSNSVSFLTDIDSFADAPARSSDACEEFFDLRPASPTISEDLFLDWESDQTGLSRTPSVRGRDSDATENERIRVSDIIRKLTSNGEDHNDRELNVNHESLPRVRTSVDKSEQRIFFPVYSSPRIRGRQAFSDLLMQMERNRHCELEGLADRKAVSKFSHKGRIQAMLRVRFLRRGAEGKDVRRTTSTTSESSRLGQSAIMHIRQRFNVGVQNNGTDLRSQQREEVVDKAPEGEKIPLICQKTKENYQQELAEPAKPLNMLDNNLDAQKPIIANPVVDLNHQESSTMLQQDALQVQSLKNLHQESDLSSNVMQPKTSSESSSKPEFIVEETILQSTEGNEHSKNQQLIGSSNEFMNAIVNAQGDNMEEEEDTHQHLVVSDCSQEIDVSNTFSEWEEELQDYYEQQLETNQDWINDVSRPRSTWEDLRQARYQEMLDPFMENDDIRRLLNRKSVSSFLSSGLRESIDRLMMSRTQQLPNPSIIQIEEEESMDQVEEGEEVQMVAMQEAEQKELQGGEEVSEDQRRNYKKDEDELQSEQQECNETLNFPAQATSWDHNQDQEVSDNYLHPASFPSPQESHTSSSSSSETQPRSSSFTNHPSIQREFMYEMRGNMEQIRQEISELRRSINSCISMQMKLQESITEEAVSPSFHSGRKKRRDSSLSKISSKGRCCICYEMQIDSLLYRCGHMCTCFKCANDLQWSSGKCPVCQASIIDVVRAYACS